MTEKIDPNKFPQNSQDKSCQNEHSQSKHPAVSDSRVRQNSNGGLYWFVLLVVFALTSVAGRALYPESFPKVSLIVAAVFVVLGGLLHCVNIWICGKYSILAEYAVKMSVRTGIPLLATLVFFLSFDNILFKRSVLTLALFYLVLFPTEVWATLPRSERKSEEAACQDKGIERKPDTGAKE